MRRLLAVALVVVLLVGAVPVASLSDALLVRDATATPESHALAESHAATDASQTLDRMESQDTRNETNAPQTLAATDEFDNVEFHITVYENGTAEWTFSYQRTLNNESERQQFEAFAQEFNNNSTQMWRNFQDQARNLAATGQNFTGRTMKAQEFEKRAYVGGLVNDNRGVVTMTFQWTSFTYSDNETIIVGDVFEGGLYIGPNQSLVVHTGPGLQFQSVDPENPAELSGEALEESESVTWEGEYDFNNQRPRVKFQPVPGETTTTTETTTAENGSAGDTTLTTVVQEPAEGDDWSPLMLFVGAVVVLLGLAAAFAWRQGDFGSFANSGSNPGSGGTAGAVASDSGGERTTEPSVSDEELLTDEARVKKLLDENGGRMKQVNIVEETGWSKSKVSMLLSEMEDDGEISKLRVGRENIISLEGHEPDAAGSPLEE